MKESQLASQVTLDLRYYDDDYLPQLKLLMNLSETYFTPAACHFKLLLHRLDRLLVVSAPLASGISKDFFNSIDEELLLRVFSLALSLLFLFGSLLIFVRPMFSKRWTTAVPASSINKAEDAHNLYSGSKRSKK